MEAQPEDDQLTMLPAAVLRQIVRHLDKKSLINLNKTSGLLSFSIYRATGPQSGLLTDHITGPLTHPLLAQPNVSGSPPVGQTGSNQEILNTIAPISLIRQTPSASLSDFSYSSPTGTGGSTPQSPSASLLGPRRQNPNSNIVSAPQIGPAPSASLQNPSHQGSTGEGSTTHTALTPSTSFPSPIPQPTEVEIEWKALMHLPASEESANEKTSSSTRPCNRLPPLLSPTLPPFIEAALAKSERPSQGADTSEDEATEEEKTPAAVNPPPSGEGGANTEKSIGRSRRSWGRGSGSVRGESSIRGGGTELSRGRRNRDKNYWRDALGPEMSRRTRSSESRRESMG